MVRKILLKLFVLIQMFLAFSLSADSVSDANVISELIHQQMFVEKKKPRQMSIIIDPLFLDHPNSYKLNLKTFYFHDGSTIKYDEKVVLDSKNTIDIPITFKSKPIDIPSSLSAECTHKLYPMSTPLQFSIKDKSKALKLPNGKNCKLIAINKKSFKISSPANCQLLIKVIDKKGDLILETVKTDFTLSKEDKKKAIHSLEISLVSEKYTKPLQLSLNFDASYAKKISDSPSDKHWTREDHNKRDFTVAPTVISDETLAAFNYKLIDEKIVFCENEKEFSFQNHMNIINDESIILLGDSYIKKLSSSYFEDNFTKSIDLSTKEPAQLALIKTRVLAPTKQIKLEVTRTKNRDTQSIVINDNTNLEVQFKENSLNYQFMKNGQVVDLSDLTPFPMTFEAVYNSDGRALKHEKNGCYWGYPQKLVLSIPMAPKTKSIDQVIKVRDISQAQYDQLISNYENINKVAELMAKIHSLSNQLPQENDIIFSENLAALHYLNNEDNKITTHYPQEIAHSDPKGQEVFKYQAKPYMGYYITVNNKIESSDSNFIDIQKWTSSKDFSYKDEDLEFTGVKKKDWGLIAIPVDPSTMPHLYSNYEQYFKFFDQKQDAKPASVWKTGWSSL